MSEIDMEKQESMKRYAEVFQELNNQRKMINEDIKDTRESYMVSGELSKEEIKQVEMAIKMIKGHVDFEKLTEVASSIESRVKVGD